MRKVCVIGAGPSGLSIAKNLKDLNIDFDGYDGSEEVGGLWNIKNKRSTVYESAHLISSKRMTEFKDFPMGDDVADYPSHKEMFKYFNDYADHFKLKEHYTFNTLVDKVERKEDETWDVTLSNGETKNYAHVVIANGTLAEPNIPTFKGEFTGELIHSSKYKTNDLFKDKRVLVVGAGNSGCDIAVDAIHRAKKVSISLRRGYYFIPKYIFGKPIDEVGGKIKFPPAIKRKIDGFILKMFLGKVEKFGLPKPDYKLYESHPVINSLIIHHLGHGDIDVKKDIDYFKGKTVYFKDGTQEEYDIILLATGYKLHYPFISKEHLNWKGQTPDLYLQIFHPQYNNLFVIGMVEAAGLGWEGRNEQAKLAAKFIAEYERNSDKAKKFIEKKKNTNVDLRGGYNYIELERMSYYVNKDLYRGRVAKDIKSLS